MLRDSAFAAVLIIASGVDIRSRTVPKAVLLALLAVGLIGVSLTALAWAALIFVLMFGTALACPDLGGGDVKFGTMCAFVLGDSKILFALLMGLMICMIWAALYCFIRHKPLRGTSMPLVPFLSFGCLLINFL